MTLDNLTTSIPAALRDLRFVSVDGLQIRYAQGGRSDGPQILLLGTWPESILAYAPTWEAFVAIGQVTAVDPPGYGGSEGRADLMSPEAMGNFLPRIMAALNLERPHVVGPDIATPASLYAELGHPGLFASLTVGGGATDASDIHSDLEVIVNAPSLDAFKDMTGEAFVRGAVGTMETYALPPVALEDYIDAYAGERFLQSVMFVREYPRALPRLAKRLHEIRTPCQIVVGGRDPYVPISNAELLKRELPNSRLHVLDCGHFAWEDKAQDYAALAAAWISGGYAEA